MALRERDMQIVEITGQRVVKSKFWNRAKDAIFGAPSVRDAEAGRIGEPDIQFVENGISMTGRDLYEQISEKNKKDYEDDYKSFRERLWKKSIKINGTP